MNPRHTAILYLVFMSATRENLPLSQWTHKVKKGRVTQLATGDRFTAGARARIALGKAA
jgi:hypothetical protein